MIALAEGAWQLSSNGSICIWFQVAINLSLPYLGTKNAEMVNEFKFDGNATIDLKQSYCNDTKSLLVLQPKTNKGVEQLWVNFEMKDGKSVISQIKAKYNPSEFKDSTDNTTRTAMTTDPINLGDAKNAYKCGSNLGWDLISNGITKQGEVAMQDALIQAFNVKGNNTSEKKNVCAADQPTPTIPPKPEEDKFSLKDNNSGKFCVLVEGKFQFAIPYLRNVNGTKSNATLYLNIANTTSQVLPKLSSCNATESTQVITIQLLTKKMTERAVEAAATPPYWVQMTFKKNSDKYSVEKVQLHYTLDKTYFPQLDQSLQGTVKNALFNGTTFEASTSNSYLCNSNTTLDLTSGSTTVTMSVTDFQYQAFAKADKADGFSSADQCSADDNTSDIVPIAVGCALAGLVLIVLIAYVIGRRRANRGYQTV